MTDWRMRGRWAAMVAASVVACSCGFHHTKITNPITKDTQQPDKLLYDKAVDDMRHGRYERARLTLNTLINTYDTSEYLAKAKLAIADSWYDEGGVSGMAQAEQDYKDFELYFPTMPEAAEAQYKICKTHQNQMSKPDRDANQALRAEQECKQVVLQYPNSKYVPETEQILRNIDEVLAEGEMRVGDMYGKKGSRASAANRYEGIVEQYPLFSRADEALWKQADEYLGMGAGMRSHAVTSLQLLVKEYPLSQYADAAKKKLRDLEAEVPPADPAAMARMKYEQDNRTKTSMLHDMTGFLRAGPDTTMAAKEGTPAMNPPKQLVPVNVPTAGQTTAAGGFNGDVTVAPVAANSPAGANPAASITDPAKANASSTAKDASTKDSGKKKNDKKNNKKNQKQDQKPDQSAAPATTPASAPDQTQPDTPKP